MRIIGETNLRPKIVRLSSWQHGQRSLKGNEEARILDLNADTGRLAFELAKNYQDVTGLDFTARMIRIQFNYKNKGMQDIP